MTDFFELHPDAQAERLAKTGKTALAAWGIVDAQLSLIKYRENAVFEVNHASGRHALRMHRVGYHSDDELRSELQWMSALADSGIAVPMVVPTTAGDLFITQTGDDLPGAVQIDLFEWVDGEQLGSVEQGVADAAGVSTMFSTLGEIAAQVHNQSSEWCEPPGYTRHAWDESGLAGDDPFWGRYWELEGASKAQKEMMLRVRDTVHEELRGFPKTKDTYGMIHADFALENLLVDGDRVRLIDFDDAGFGWHLFEIATALYFIREEPYYQTAFDALIEGYRRHRTLTDEHLKHLPLFYLARAFTYIGWVHTRQETETAREMTPYLMELAFNTAQEYWANSGSEWR